VKQNYLVELISGVAERFQGYYCLRRTREFRFPRLCCDWGLISDSTSTALLRGCLL